MQEALSIAPSNAPEKVVAWLRWERNQPQVRWRKGAHREARLERWLAASARYRPCTMRRLRQRDVEELFYDPLPVDDPHFYERWAAELNFAHAETLPYRANPVVLADRETAELWLSRDLLGVEDATAWPRPLIRCACGQATMLGTATCRDCGGAEPLGAFLHAHRKSLESALIEATQNALSPAPPLAAAQALLDVLRAVPRPSQPVPKRNESPRVYAQRLIPYIHSSLSLPGLSPAITESFQAASKRDTALMARAEELALSVRQWWQPAAGTGWRPKPLHEAAIRDAFQSTWEATGPALAAMARTYKAACLAYLPVRPILDRKDRPGRLASPGQPQPTLHPFWGGADALARSPLERSAMAHFAEQLAAARTQLETATSVLSVALEEARNHNINHQHAAYAYLRMMVLEDYAAVHASERQRWVQGLANRLDLSFESPEAGRRSQTNGLWRWVGALSSAAGTAVWFFIP